MTADEAGGARASGARGSLIGLVPSWVRRGMVLLIAACILCIPAFYNGYPLIFSDLLEYASDGMILIRKVWPWGHGSSPSALFQATAMWPLWPGGNRPPFYGIAIWPLHMETSLWPVVIAQGLIMSHLLSTTLRACRLALSGPAFLGVIAGLALFTSLPWYVSHVMPDVFGGVLVLSLFLLAFRGDALSRGEKVYFSCLAGASVLMHVAFLPVAMAEMLLAAGFWLSGRRGAGSARPLAATIPVVAAVCFSSFVTTRIWGTPWGVPHPPPYLLAHTLVDGPGKKFLEATCARQSYAICEFRDSIPDDVEDFMFRSFSPFRPPDERKAGKIRAEAGAIVIGSARMFPLETLRAAVRSGLAQIVTFETEVAQLEDIPGWGGGSLGDILQERLPFMGKGYEHTKQKAGLLDSASLRGMNALHLCVVALSVILGVFFSVRAAAVRNWTVIQLLAAACTAILVNGFVAGAMVGVFGRFGARTIWLLPFAVCVAGLSLRQAVRRTAERVPPSVATGVVDGLQRS